MIICEIIVRLLVTVQNNKRYTVHSIDIMEAQQAKIYNYRNTRLKLLKTNAAIWFNKNNFRLLYAFLWAIPRRLICVPTFRNTLFHVHRQVVVFLHTTTCLRRWNIQSVPKRRHTKFRRPGNNPEESIQHLEHGESLKSRIIRLYYQQLHLKYWCNLARY